MVDRLAPASLMLMAILWGSTFFVLKDMLTRIDASDLLAVRFTIAALVLVALLHRRLHRLVVLPMQQTVGGKCGIVILDDLVPVGKEIYMRQEQFR